MDALQGNLDKLQPFSTVTFVTKLLSVELIEFVDQSEVGPH